MSHVRVGMLQFAKIHRPAFYTFTHTLYIDHLHTKVQKAAFRRPERDRGYTSLAPTKIFGFNQL